MQKWKWGALACALFMGMGVAGCGGGGGDSGSSQPPPKAPTDVTIALDAGQSVAFNVEHGIQRWGQLLTGSFTGNRASLDGEFFHAKLDNPGPFESLSVAYLDDLSGQFHVWVDLKNGLPEGRYTGTLKLRICVDEACQAELKGSPYDVPYDVRVMPEVKVSATTIHVDAVFGSVPARRAITFEGPSRFTNGFGYGRAGSSGDPVAFDLNWDSQGPVAGIVETVYLDFYPTAPGTHTETVGIDIEFESGGARYLVHRELEVIYVTADNPAVDYVITPPGGIDHEARNGAAPVANFWAVSRPGVTMTWRGVEYLSAPPAASGNPLATSWWFESSGGVMHSCPHWGPYGPGCLPAGTYTARGHWTMTKGGVVSEVYYPLTMRVVP